MTLKYHQSLPDLVSGLFNRIDIISRTPKGALSILYSSLCNTANRTRMIAVSVLTSTSGGNVLCPRSSLIQKHRSSDVLPPSVITTIPMSDRVPLGVDRLKKGLFLFFGRSTKPMFSCRHTSLVVKSNPRTLTTLSWRSLQITVMTRQSTFVCWADSVNLIVGLS